MKTTININGKEVEIELTSEQVAKIKQEQGGRWIPKINEYYWLVMDFGSMHKEPWKYIAGDNFRLSQGNVFKTKKEAQKHLEYLQAVATVKEDAGWWKPKLGEREEKYSVAFYEDNEDFVVDSVTYYLELGAIYFQTEEQAQKSLDTHRKEWEIIRDYESK